MSQSCGSREILLNGGLAFLQMASVLLNCEKQKRKKGGEIMKSLKANLSMLLVVGVLGTSGATLAADGVVVEGELTPGNYCHEKFPAITERSLGDNQPQLKQSTTGERHRLLRSVRRGSYGKRSDRDSETRTATPDGRVPRRRKWSLLIERGEALANA